GTPLPGVTPGEDLQVRYRVVELGTRDTEVLSHSYNGLLGTEVDISDKWQVSVNGAHSRIESEDKGVNGYAIRQQVVDAISSGQFNPFAPEGQRGSIEHTRYVPIERTMSQLSSLEVKATGEIA